jgi:DNA-binding response OmpR family regulator
VDLVLADLTLTDTDGARLIEQIKVLSPHTPAILFSNRVRIYERETCADVFLPKGAYSPAEVLERIRHLLARKRGPRRIPAGQVAAPAAGVGAA